MAMFVAHVTKNNPVPITDARVRITRSPIVTGGAVFEKNGSDGVTQNRCLNGHVGRFLRPPNLRTSPTDEVFADTDKRSNKNIGRPLWRWARLPTMGESPGCASLWMQDFGKQNEGELRLLHFNPKRAFTSRAFGVITHEALLGVRCTRRVFSSFNVCDFHPLAGGFQAGHSN